MSSFLSKKEGIYDPGRRYSFTNISDQPFQLKWNSQVAGVLQPGESMELSDATPFPGSGNGQALGYLFTKQLVDRIMFGEAKADELVKNTPYYRSPLATRAGIPVERHPYEEKILKELPQSESMMKILLQQKGDEITQDMLRQPGVSYAQQPAINEIPKNFADVSPDAQSNAPTDFPTITRKGKKK